MSKSQRKPPSRQQRRKEMQQKQQQQNQLITALAAGLLVIVALVVVWQLLPDSEPESNASAEGVPVEVDGTVVETERFLTEFPPSARNDFYQRPPDRVLEGGVDYQALIVTEKGEMLFDLYEDETPLTVNNFVFLANNGFYDGTTFHRVIADFMAQGGDPEGTGTGGPGYAFEDEIVPELTFDRRGLLAMANSGADTNGSQFFITFAETSWLNGAHTIFGELLAGDETLSAITIREPRSATPADEIIRIDIIRAAP